jgi:hypothetical protein
VIALALASAAHAFTLTGYAWNTDGMPLTVALDDHTAFAARHAEALAVAEAAWTDGCADLRWSNVPADPDADIQVTLGARADIGVRRWGSSGPSAPMFQVDGTPIRPMQAAAIGLGLDEHPSACGETRDLEVALATDLGWTLGIEWAHLDGGEPCGPPRLGADDRAALGALYGTTPGMDCHADQGHVPAVVRCEVDGRAPDAVTGATWDFGDGSTSEDLAPQYTWTVPGTYAVSACFASDDVCAAACRTLPPRTVCPSQHLVIDVAPVDRSLFVQLGAGADESVPGCVRTPHWSVSSGGRQLWEQDAFAPIVRVPAEGIYTAVLDVEYAPGASLHLEKTFDVAVEPPPAQGTSGGCSTVPAGLAGVLGLAACATRLRATGVAAPDSGSAASARSRGRPTSRLSTRARGPSPCRSRSACTSCPRTGTRRRARTSPRRAAERAGAWRRRAGRCRRAG